MSDSLVRCSICGREERVSFGVCLRHGWPQCCRNYTMTLVTTETDIAAATTHALREQMPDTPKKVVA